MTEEKTVGYTKTYRLRRLFPKKKHCLVGMPWDVIKRQAAIHDMTPEEFIDKFVVVAEYDNFEGVHYTFKEANHDKES
jgi:hypothetical protein